MAPQGNIYQHHDEIVIFTHPPLRGIRNPQTSTVCQSLRNGLLNRRLAFAHESISCNDGPMLTGCRLPPSTWNSAIHTFEPTHNLDAGVGGIPS